MFPQAVWFEIPAAELSRAQSFYEQLFEVSLRRCEGDGEAMAFFPGDIGAISECADLPPTPDGVVVYFGAEGMLRPLLSRVQQAGGAVLRDITPIAGGTKGAFAWFQDSEGNRLGLYSPSGH